MFGIQEKGASVRGSYRNDKNSKNGNSKLKQTQKQQKGPGVVLPSGQLSDSRKKPIELRYVPPNEGDHEGEVGDDSNLIIAQDEEEFHEHPNGGPPILHDEGDPQDHQGENSGK